MSESTGKVKADPLFLGLTRPTMVLGVTYMWFAVEGLSLAVYFVQTSDFAGMILGAMLIHGIGFMLSANEPRFMEIMMIGAKTNAKCTNRFFHGGTSSYDLY